MSSVVVSGIVTSMVVVSVVMSVVVPVVVSGPVVSVVESVISSVGAVVVVDTGRLVSSTVEVSEVDSADVLTSEVEVSTGSEEVTLASVVDSVVSSGASETAVVIVGIISPNLTELTERASSDEVSKFQLSEAMDVVSVDTSALLLSGSDSVDKKASVLESLQGMVVIDESTNSENVVVNRLELVSDGVLVGSVELKGLCSVDGWLPQL